MRREKAKRVSDYTKSFCLQRIGLRYLMEVPYRAE